MQIPQHYLNRPGRGLGAQVAQGINAAQPPRISIAGGRFSLVDVAGNVQPVLSQFIDQRTGQAVQQHATEVDVIIVGTNPGLSKVYYAGAYDPSGEGGPPTCFSDNHVAPSTQAASPQSETCAACPHAAWGSRINTQTGQKSKACSDRKKIAVMLAYSNDTTVYQLQVPPASLKAVQALAFWANQQDLGGRKADISDLITRISFVSGVTGQLNFAGAGLYDDATYMRIEQLIQNDQAKIDAICGNNDVPVEPGRIAAHPAQNVAVLPGGAYGAPAQITHQPQQVQNAGPFIQPAAPVQPQQYHPPVGAPGQFQQQPQQIGHIQQPLQPQAANPQQPPQKARRGRGRPAADAAPSQQPAAVQAFQQPAAPLAVGLQGPASAAPPVSVLHAAGGTPSFLQPPPVQQVAPTAQPHQSFGLVNQPAVADPGLTAQLNEAFNLLPRPSQ